MGCCESFFQRTSNVGDFGSSDSGLGLRGSYIQTSQVIHIYQPSLVDEEADLRQPEVHYVEVPKQLSIDKHFDRTAAVQNGAITRNVRVDQLEDQSQDTISENNINFGHKHGVQGTGNVVANFKNEITLEDQSPDTISENSYTSDHKQESRKHEAVVVQSGTEADPEVRIADTISENSYTSDQKQELRENEAVVIQSGTEADPDVRIAETISENSYTSDQKEESRENEAIVIQSGTEANPEVRIADTMSESSDRSDQKLEAQESEATSTASETEYNIDDLNPETTSATGSLSDNEREVRDDYRESEHITDSIHSEQDIIPGEKMTTEDQFDDTEYDPEKSNESEKESENIITKEMENINGLELENNKTTDDNVEAQELGHIGYDDVERRTEIEQLGYSIKAENNVPLYSISAGLPTEDNTHDAIKLEEQKQRNSFEAETNDGPGYVTNGGYTEHLEEVDGRASNSLVNLQLDGSAEDITLEDNDNDGVLSEEQNMKAVGNEYHVEPLKDSKNDDHPDFTITKETEGGRTETTIIYSDHNDTTVNGREYSQGKHVPENRYGLKVSAMKNIYESTESKWKSPRKYHTNAYFQNGSSNHTETKQVFSVQNKPSEEKSTIQVTIDTSDKKIADLTPRPPRTKKKDIIPDVTVFSEIDNHALEAPDHLRSNVQDLVRYLIQPAETQLDRIRAFYRWITDNISCDTENANQFDRDGNFLSDILTSGMCVCEGHAKLFEEFCKSVDIPVKTISGYAKGRTCRWTPGDTVIHNANANHAWNAVYVLGEWRCLDCAFGAGYLDKSGRFCWSFKEFYFLTDPEHFIEEHFPHFSEDGKTNEQWQLLSEPLSLSHFSDKLHLRSLAMELYIKPLSQLSEVITTGGVASIRFSVPSEISKTFLCCLNTANGEIRDECVMMELVDERWLTIHLLIAEEGVYFLELLIAPDERETNENDILLAYKLQCNGSDNVKRQYPKLGKAWGPVLDFRAYGFTDQVAQKARHVAENGIVSILLETFCEVDILVSLQHAEYALEQDKTYYFISEKSDRSTEISLRLPFEGYYKLVIFGKLSSIGTDSYHEVINYLVQCDEPMQPFIPFPQVYGKADEFGVTLLEPRHGELPAKTMMLFRIEAPLLQKVVVGDTHLEKVGDLFEGTIMTPEAGGNVTVYGRDSKLFGLLNGLFSFSII